MSGPLPGLTLRPLSECLLFDSRIILEFFPPTRSWPNFGKLQFEPIYNQRESQNTGRIKYSGNKNLKNE